MLDREHAAWHYALSRNTLLKAIPGLGARCVALWPIQEYSSEGFSWTERTLPRFLHYPNPPDLRGPLRPAPFRPALPRSAPTAPPSPGSPLPALLRPAPPRSALRRFAPPRAAPFRPRDVRVLDSTGKYLHAYDETCIID